MKKLFSHDPLTGITKYFHYDEGQDAKNFVIETIQQTTPIVDQNKEEFNNSRASTRGEDMVKVASIPLALFFELKKKGITQDPVAFKRWLNDPDNRLFRTRPGTV
ncbi:hypothetical protein [Sinorhizobium phage phiM5]|nr:hypothetical protein [Sinorhizobium phage phiM5]